MGEELNNKDVEKGTWSHRGLLKVRFYLTETLGMKSLKHVKEDENTGHNFPDFFCRHFFQDKFCQAKFFEQNL